jgi:large subunit ribosomal protein L30
MGIMPVELEITYVKSAIGYSERQKRTVQALGLRKLHDSVRQPDNPSIRGMIHSVQHLLSFREVELPAAEPANANAQGPAVEAATPNASAIPARFGTGVATSGTEEKGDIL